MGEGRVTDAGQYTVIDGQLLHVTDVGAYTVVEGQIVRITSAGQYTVIGREQARVTAAGVYVVVAPCGPGIRPRYTYGGVDITAYCHEMDLQAAGRELEATHLDSGAEEADAGLHEYSIRLGGDWSPTLDGLLAVDALNGTRRTGIASFERCAQATQYTWQEVYLTNWQVFTQARGKIGWRAILRHDGQPERAIVEL